MSDVDASGAADDYAMCMQLLRRQAARHKQLALNMLDLYPGQTVLDVGCGAGDDLVALAERVAPGGKVVGIDASLQLLEKAKESAQSRGLPIELHRADARQIDFPDAAFDRSRAERVLQHMEDPSSAVAEMVRVTRPGGRVVLVDADYDSLLIDADDFEVTQVVVRRRADAAPSGRVGRQLRRLMLNAGLIDIETEAIGFIWTDHELAMTSLDLLTCADQAVADGEFSRERVAAWASDLAARAARGGFFLSSFGFIAAGRRPGR